MTARWWPWLLAALMALPAPGGARADPSNCGVPASLSTIDAALARAAARIAETRRLNIVAIGSSSTLGVGSSTPAMSYPSRLERALSQDMPGVEVHVVNHGVGGQDVGEELGRLERDVIGEHPDLVIWQVGTNAVLRHDDLAADEALIRRGVALMKDKGIDVVLMDLQYAPRVLARAAYDEMERILAETAREAHIGLFHRFAVMRLWAETQQLAPAAIIGPDGLHMTDVSYGCLALDLAQSLASRLSRLPRHADAARARGHSAAAPASP